MLHDVATALLQQLVRDFDVERTEGYGVDPELEGHGPPARPTATLTPRDNEAAPIVVAFSRFPGLRVRLGRWCTLAFPACGCDACHENGEDEAARLQWTIGSIVEGGFCEGILVAETTAWTEWTVWSTDRREHASVSRDWEHAQRLRDASNRSFHAWKPWPRRGRSHDNAGPDPSGPASPRSRSRTR